MASLIANHAIVRRSHCVKKTLALVSVHLMWLVRSVTNVNRTRLDLINSSDVNSAIVIRWVCKMVNFNAI